MLWTVYLRNGTAFVPTVAQTDAGFFLNIDPVGVVPATDTEALRYAIQQALARGNPKVPTPARATFPKPVLLKYAKTKSWSAFEKACLNWTIEEKDGVYQVKQGRKRPDRGWEDDPTRIEVLPPGTGIEQVAQRVTFTVQNALETSERSRSK